MHEWDFAATLADMELLMLGLWNTLQVFVLALVFGIPLGLGLALGRMSRIPVLSQVCLFLIEFFRTTPPLVQLFWFFFALPILISAQMTPFVASVLTFSIQSSAFFAEIFRGGINSIDKGQWEAARAVGLSPLNVLRDIIFPQAIRKILPPLAGQFITLIKDSAIVSLISIQELTFLATEVASTTTKVFETWIIVGAMYFVLCYSFATLFGHLEKRAMRTRR